MNDSAELAVLKPENPSHLMRLATDVAGVCKDIVLKTSVTIQGRKYVPVEGWMSIATAHGCIASSRNVEKIEGGYRAIGEIRRMSDGTVLSTAEGFVGMDETKTWAQRPEYACRAMAQTRAISRACRAAFAHVVVLMNAGLSTTPLEEVPDGGFPEQSHQPAAAPKPAATPPPPEKSANPPVASAAAPSAGLSEGNGVVLVEYKQTSGEKNGKPWTRYDAQFEHEGQQLAASTFSDTLGEALAKFKGGEKVDIKYKAGRMAGKFDLVSITETDDVPF